VGSVMCVHKRVCILSSSIRTMCLSLGRHLYTFTVNIYIIHCVIGSQHNLKILIQ
jgi:hypothetical protein